MAPKSLVVLAALLVVIVAAGKVPRGAASLGASTSINSSVLVSGVVPCAAGNSINAATAPVFSNAALQLVCGSSKQVVSTTTADGNGAFLLSTSVDRDQLVSVLGDQCKVVVVTPLGACDKSLSAVTGTLTAPLKLLGIVTGSGSDLGGLGGLIGGIAGLIGQIIGGILNLGTQSFSLV